MNSEQKIPEKLEQERKDQDPAKHEAFLQKDYELKITYLTNHFTRMWSRFNYFVAIETGLVGGKFLIPNNVVSRELAIAGILISAVWYIMGAEDRYLVRLYRHQVDQAGEQLARTVLSFGAAPKAFRYVGQLDKEARAELKKAEGKDGKGSQKSFLRRMVEFDWLSGWRWEPLSTTRLAALFPLLVLILWLVILIMG